jgi:hypothetical protein
MRESRRAEIHLDECAKSVDVGQQVSSGHDGARVLRERASSRWISGLPSGAGSSHKSLAGIFAGRRQLGSALEREARRLVPAPRCEPRRRCLKVLSHPIVRWGRRRRAMPDGPVDVVMVFQRVGECSMNASVVGLGEGGSDSRANERMAHLYTTCHGLDQA